MLPFFPPLWCSLPSGHPCPIIPLKLTDYFWVSGKSRPAVSTAGASAPQRNGEGSVCPHRSSAMCTSYLPPCCFTLSSAVVNVFGMCVRVCGRERGRVCVCAREGLTSDKVQFFPLQRPFAPTSRCQPTTKRQLRYFNSKTACHNVNTTQYLSLLLSLSPSFSSKEVRVSPSAQNSGNRCD